MHKNVFWVKWLVVGIIILFIVAGFVNAIGGDYNNEQDTLSLTFYTFDKTGTNKCKVELSTDVADYVSDMFEDLIDKISVDPDSVESKLLKVDFVDLLDSYGLVPDGLSKDYVVSLLSPWWLGFVGRVNPFVRFDGSSVRDGFLPIGSMGSTFFCGVGGFGAGFMFLPIMFPRPRLVATWSSFFGGYSYAANLLTGHGFVAEGAQFGSALGFMGIGLSFVYPGYPAFFGFYGYSLFAHVNAEVVDFYPPNQEPVISDENPPHGTWEVPVSLSELSFRISDADGDRMSYWVTTDPDIGSGEGHLKNDGVYSIPVSDVVHDKQYSWTVRVSDGTNTVEKQFGFITEAGPPFDPFDEGWQYRKKITIDHDMVDGDLSNFPVLVSLFDSDLASKAQVDGDDILFMDGVGVTKKLYHEIEDYDGGFGGLVAWVNIPFLSSGVDTDFYMYYGNPSVSDQQTAELVWDVNYVSVLHMKDDPDDAHIVDSTVFNNDGIKKYNNEPAEINGKIGKAQDFDGSNDYIDTKDFDINDDFTISLWINPSSTEYWQCWLGKHSSDKGNILVFGYWERDENKGYGFNIRDSSYRNGVMNTGWHQMVYIAEKTGSSSTKATVYKNGQFLWQYDLSEIIGNALGESWTIGQDWDSSGRTDFFNGVIDEVRISNSIKDSQWISTEYSNQNNPSNFYNIGLEETAP